MKTEIELRPAAEAHPLKTGWVVVSQIQSYSFVDAGVGKQMQSADLPPRLKRLRQFHWIRSLSCMAAIAALASLAACKSRTELTAEEDTEPLTPKDYFCLVTPNECNREAYSKLFPD